MINTTERWGFRVVASGWSRDGPYVRALAGKDGSQVMVRDRLNTGSAAGTTIEVLISFQTNRSPP